MRLLYDDDILLWSEEQALALRALNGEKTAPRADWDRVAAAIEDVGRSALTRVERGIRLMLTQAIAGYCDPDSLRRHERIALTHAGRDDAEDELTATMRARLDVDSLWREAFDRAMAEIPRRVLGVPPGIPRTCPFTLDELLAEDFTYDRAVERLYVLLTSWRPKAEKDAQT